MREINHMRPTEIQLVSHRSHFVSSQPLRHAGVSPKTLGAWCLLNGDNSPDVLYNNNPRRDIDNGNSTVDDNDDHCSIDPTTTGNSHHITRYESLLITLFYLQLPLFSIRNQLLSLWD